MEAIDETADYNEPDAARSNRCRVSMRPDRYVWLTDGEVHDHRAWGSLMEEPETEPPAQSKPQTPPSGVRTQTPPTTE